MRQATVKHLIYGSPSDWLGYAAARIVPLRWVGAKRRPGATETAERELSALPRLYPDGRGLSARDLALCG